MTSRATAGAANADALGSLIEPAATRSVTARNSRYRDRTDRVPLVVGCELAAMHRQRAHQGRIATRTDTTATKGARAQALKADRAIKTAGSRRLPLSTSLCSVRITRRMPRSTAPQRGGGGAEPGIYAETERQPDQLWLAGS